MLNKYLVRDTEAEMGIYVMASDPSEARAAFFEYFADEGKPPDANPVVYLIPTDDECPREFETCHSWSFDPEDED